MKPLYLEFVVKVTQFRIITQFTLFFLFVPVTIPQCSAEVHVQKESGCLIRIIDVCADECLSVASVSVVSI